MLDLSMTTPLTSIQFPEIKFHRLFEKLPTVDEAVTDSVSQVLGQTASVGDWSEKFANWKKKASLYEPGKVTEKLRAAVTTICHLFISVLAFVPISIHDRFFFNRSAAMTSFDSVVANAFSPQNLEASKKDLERVKNELHGKVQQWLESDKNRKAFTIPGRDGLYFCATASAISEAKSILHQGESAGLGSKLQKQLEQEGYSSILELTPEKLVELLLKTKQFDGKATEFATLQSNAYTPKEERVLRQINLYAAVLSFADAPFKLADQKVHNRPQAMILVEVDGVSLVEKTGAIGKDSDAAMLVEGQEDKKVLNEGKLQQVAQDAMTGVLDVLDAGSQPYAIETSGWNGGSYAGGYGPKVGESVLKGIFAAVEQKNQDENASLKELVITGPGKVPEGKFCGTVPTHKPNEEQMHGAKFLGEKNRTPVFIYAGDGASNLPHGANGWVASSEGATVASTTLAALLTGKKGVFVKCGSEQTYRFIPEQKNLKNGSIMSIQAPKEEDTAAQWDLFEESNGVKTSITSWKNTCSSPNVMDGLTLVEPA